MSELIQMRNRITELERQRENASNNAYLSYCEGLELKAKLEIATEALEFYSGDETLEDYECQLDWDRVNKFACEQDRGKRARQALKEIKGEQ